MLIAAAATRRSGLGRGLFIIRLILTLQIIYGSFFYATFAWPFISDNGPFSRAAPF